MRLNDHFLDNTEDINNNFGEESYIGSRAYSSMLYNSFDRAYGLGYTFDSSSEIFDAGATIPDGFYTSDAFEQAFWAVSPYSESPDARADQILPNAFFLGNQDRDFMFNFIVKPYQYTGFTQQVQSALADPEYLINKNIHLRFLGIEHGGSGNRASAANTPGGLNYLPIFAIPPSDVDASSSSYEYISGAAIDMYSTYGGNENLFVPANGGVSGKFQSYPFYIAHIIHDSPQNFPNHILSYESDDASEYLVDRTSRKFLHLPNKYYPYLSGRIPGFLTDTVNNYTTYALTDSANLYTLNMFPRNTNQAMLQYDVYHGGFYNPKRNYTYLEAMVGDRDTTMIGTVNSSIPYAIGRSILPHHEDDFDFDRGQISSHKLGFHLDDTQIFDYDTEVHANLEFGHRAQSLFFPSNPALVTGYTQASDTIAFPYDDGNQYHGIGKVGNYYPAIQSQESLYTEFASTTTASGSTVPFASYPTITETISGRTEIDLSKSLSELRAYEADGRYVGQGSYYGSIPFNTRLYRNEHQSQFIRTIPLDRIFPEGYSYQLGFINREELFMYSPAWVASGGSGSPEINRFYASSVGNFGYATQFSRLNRRAMKKYHMATSSQFLGDHLTRFTSVPAAGVHTPSDIDAVFAHTPAEQGAAATAYGSYAAGYYDVDTSGNQPDESSVPHSISFQSRWVTGTLRGYVLELRTNPLTDDEHDGRTATSGLSSNADVATSMEDLVEAQSGTHPD